MKLISVFTAVVFVFLVSAGWAQAPATSYDCSAVTEIPAIECQALVAFYDSTNGADWTENAGWLTDNTPCSWHGVGCDTGHVRSLWLLDNNLSGSVPPELGNLSNLRRLYLGANQLSGSIPRKLKELTGLEVLYLHGNQLSGGIPESLGALSNLKDLQLQSNLLTGPLPQTMIGLKQLNTFFFDRDLLCMPDNPPFAAWYAGISTKVADAMTCTRGWNH